MVIWAITFFISLFYRVITLSLRVLCRVLRPAVVSSAGVKAVGGAGGDGAVAPAAGESDQDLKTEMEPGDLSAIEEVGRAGLVCLM